MYVCMYLCMYVCSRNTAKTGQDSAKILGPPYHSPAVCSIKFRSNWATKKLFKKSIPDSIKYSSGEFDQCKQPQRYSSLELSFFFFS